MKLLNATVFLHREQWWATLHGSRKVLGPYRSSGNAKAALKLRYRLKARHKWQITVTNDPEVWQ